MVATIDATPLRTDLKLYRGDDFFVAVEVGDPDTGEPSDLTGAVASAQIRLSADTDIVAAEFGIVVADNVVFLHLSAVDSTLLPPAGAWDCQLAWPDDTVNTLVYGRVSVTDEVTR